MDWSNSFTVVRRFGVVVVALLAMEVAESVGLPLTHAEAGGGAEYEPIHALVVTGGHGFDRGPFFEMWKSIPGLTFHEGEHPHAHAVLTPASARKYDVVVLYDMWQPIDESAQRSFATLVRDGMGVVALHHSICGYNDWPEYRKIIGGRFRVKELDGKKPSVYKHDVRFRVKVHGGHQVTAGLRDFDVFDETYGDFDVNPGVRRLLSTDDPTSGKTIGWAHEYGRGRVVTIQPGHGPNIFGHPSYRKLLAQAVRWAARRDTRSGFDL